MTEKENILYAKYQKEYEKKMTGIDITSDKAYKLHKDTYLKYFGKKQKKDESIEITDNRHLIYIHDYKENLKRGCPIDIKMEKLEKEVMKRVAERQEKYYKSLTQLT